MGHIEAPTITFGREENMVVIFCIYRFGKYGVEFDDGLPFNELGLSKVLKPILWAFHCVEQSFPIRVCLNYGGFRPTSYKATAIKYTKDQTSASKPPKYVASTKIRELRVL